MSDEPIPVAVVGVGKIAREQHLPAISADPEFRLVAAVSRTTTVGGVPTFQTLTQLLTESPAAAALALCAPPGVRTEMAMAGLRAGRDVLLEKPPAASLGEIETLRETAAANGCVLFATWHSRFAAGVATARNWLDGRNVTAARIVWKEDVRRWHPKQDWIWEPGGFGVFDPGINALSILTEILPGAVLVERTELAVPLNRTMPIAARLGLRLAGGAAVDVEFDWRQEGPQTWDIEVETDGGRLRLGSGGARLEIDGQQAAVSAAEEYAGIYRRFAALVRSRRSEVDAAPLRIVADAFMLAKRVTVEPFHE